MPEPDFEKLVKEFADRQLQEDADNAVDWNEMKTWWVGRVNDLFNQIDEWLDSLIKSGSVKTIRKITQLKEENLGLYDIESFEVMLTSRKLSFEPKGTMLIGAFGRIEVRGPTGNAVFLLLNTDNTVPRNKRRDHVDWFIAHPVSNARPLPRIRSELRALTRESFQQLFTDLFGIHR